MSGYEQHPDYGGRPVTWVSIAFAVVVVVAAGLSLAMCAAAPASQEPASQQIIGRAEATDGDTLRIGEARIRLWGIDAPERGVTCRTAAGDLVDVHAAAKRALIDTVSDQSVRCEPRSTDRHGRAVAVCAVGDRDIAGVVVAAGWAWDWPRYSGGAYAVAERQARAVRRGLWDLTCEDVRSGRSLD